MRAKEFIPEGREGSIQDDVARALPTTYSVPDLQNQDPYRQYRFGVALAGARGSGPKQPDDFAPHTPWGENAIVVAYDKESDQMVGQALDDIGIGSKNKKMISTARSEEARDVSKISPVARVKKNRYGV